MKEKDTQLLLPGGEWLASLLFAFRLANLELRSPDQKNYRYTFVNQALPIVFDLVRSSDVPQNVDALENVAGGFTGTDILAENDLLPAWILPILALGAKAPRVAKLFLGMTPNYPYQVADNLNLETSTVYTKYPNLTQKYLEKQKQKDVAVKYRAGKIEGMWRIDPNNWAITDISSTGQTAWENEITVTKTIMKPKPGFYRDSQISKQDQLRIDDLREKIFKTTQERDQNEK